MRRIYHNFSRNAVSGPLREMGNTAVNLPLKSTIRYQLPLVSERAKPLAEFERCLDELSRAAKAFNLHVKGLQKAMKKDDRKFEEKSNRDAMIAGAALAFAASLIVGFGFGYPIEIWAPVVLVAVPAIAFALYKYEEHVSKKEQKKED